MSVPELILDTGAKRAKARWSLARQKKPFFAGKSWPDRIFHGVTFLFALAIALAFAGVLVSLFVEALPALKTFGVSFVTRAEWDPVNDDYGALIAIFGTAVTSAVALLIAVPLSFGIAVFLTELCPPFLKRPLGMAVELLAGMPSIIYGMWGLFVLVPVFSEYVQPALAFLLGWIPVTGPLFSGPMMGIGILTAGVILAVMILPFISSVMRDVFETTPAALKESAYALGCTRWEVISRVVLRHARDGMAGGVMLGLGRALGETMAVTFVIGNTHRLATSLFSPGNSIASTLANEFAEAGSRLHVSSLFALGLILFVMTFVVLSAAKLMRIRLSKQEGER
jgi:phosphate transport system permease protein